MTAVQIVRHGGPEVLRPAELPSPPLGAGEVRVSVRAAGINFAEIQMRMGMYPEAPRLPFVPGFEFAGTVTQAGREARGISPGDRVLGACRFGGYASEVVVPASQVRRIPQHLDIAEAAAIPVSFLTAWIGLEQIARVRGSDRVLVAGAAGGVGTAMVQIAHHAGAEVVALVGSEAKKRLVLDLGAASAWTYDEWRGRREVGSFDAVMDPRGGSGLKESMACLRPTGRAVSFGVSSLVTGPRRSLPRVLLQLLKTPLFTPIGLAMTNRGIHGMNMLKLFDGGPGMALLMEAMDQVLEGFEKRQYRAIVGATFPLLEAGAAHGYLQSRASTGKVVLTVP